MRMEESGNGQQVMQEKIAQTLKMVTNLTKGKGITDGPEELVSRKNGIDPFIAPNLNNPCEQESFEKKIRLDGPTTSTCSKGAVS